MVVKVLCCLQIYISVFSSLDHGPSATGQENDYDVRVNNSQLGEGLGLAEGGRVLIGDSAQKFVDQSFNSFSPSLHFNRAAPF